MLINNDNSASGKSIGPDPMPDTRIRWQGHVAAAIIDLRNSDRSPYEQMVYDFLRGIQLPPHK